MSIFSKTSALIHSRTFTFISGLITIFLALYDIYTDIFNLAHEHLLILMGIFLILKALIDTLEGVENVVSKSERNKLTHSFLHSKLATTIIGVIIMITSIYGMYEDIEKIARKSTSLFIGILLIIMPLMSLLKGFKEVTHAQKIKT